MDTTSEKLILQKLDSICKQMKEGFAANQVSHEGLEARLREIETEAAKALGHVHPHCDDCLTHTTEITALQKDISLRDKIGISALLVFIATTIKTWFFK